MDKDIEFALAVIESDYKKRRDLLVLDNTLDSRDRDNTLTSLETMLSAKLKIKAAFGGEE